MAKITNHTRASMDFITGVKDGAAITESLKAGETRDIALMDPESAAVRGKVIAGAISIEGDKHAPKVKRSQAAPAAAEQRTVSTLAGDIPVKD